MADPAAAFARVKELDCETIGVTDLHMVATSLVQLDFNAGAILEKVAALESRVKTLESRLLSQG